MVMSHMQYIGMQTGVGVQVFNSFGDRAVVFKQKKGCSWRLKMWLHSSLIWAETRFGQHLNWIRIVTN